MAKKSLNPNAVINELKGKSVFFPRPEKTTSPPSKKSPKKNPPGDIDSQTDRVTDSQTKLVTELQSNRLTDFDDYEVPDFRKLRRVELRLTWEQNRYLEDLVDVISRAMPEGERSDPNYKRITKNSIIRALVEIARRLELTVDASRFKNERDLLEAVVEVFKSELTNSQTDRVTDSQTHRVTK